MNRRILVIVAATAFLAISACTNLRYSDEGVIAPRVEGTVYEISVGGIPAEDERVASFLTKDFGMVRLSNESAVGFDEPEVRIWQYSGTILPVCVRVERLGLNPKFSFLQIKYPGTAYSRDLTQHSETLGPKFEGLMSNLTATKSLKANFEGEFLGTTFYLVEFHNRSTYQTRRFLAADNSENAQIIREFLALAADKAKLN